MSLTTNKYRRSTGERVVTLRPTIYLTADEVTALVGADTLFFTDETVDGISLDDDYIRSLINRTVLDAIERESYRVGDNRLEDRTAELKARVVAEVFDGRETI